MFLFFIAFQTSSVFSSFKDDLKVLQERLDEDGTKNIVVSPYLISTMRAIQTNLNNHFHDGTPLVSISKPQSGFKGFHVVSKREFIDERLKKFGYPHTLFSQLTQKTTDVIAQELNVKIWTKTNGNISDFIEPHTLENPYLAYALFTWFYEKVTWKESFLDVKESKLWNGKEKSKTQWMEIDENNMGNYSATSD